MKKRKAIKKTAAKKQAKKKAKTKSKRAAGVRVAKRKASGAKKKTAKSAKAKTVRGKTARVKSATAAKKPRAERASASDPREFGRSQVASRQAGQSGDIQGLSGRAGADSESVEELVDEGNAFEADAVEGVERAGNSTRGVRTRQVPEDDVQGEYLDKD